MDNEEREIRLEIHEFEEILRKASVIKKNDYVNTIHVEPGEMVISIIQAKGFVKE